MFSPGVHECRGNFHLQKKFAIHWDVYKMRHIKSPTFLAKCLFMIICGCQFLALFVLLQQGELFIAGLGKVWVTQAKHAKQNPTLPFLSINLRIIKLPLIMYGIYPSAYMRYMRTLCWFICFGHIKPAWRPRFPGTRQYYRLMDTFYTL